MKLYLVEIGGMRDGNLFECHEVHALVASSEEQLILECQVRFAGAMRAAHLDGWIELELENLTEDSRRDGTSFFIAELGRNSTRAMREEHDYRFLSAGSLREAVQAARQGAPGWHVDACVNLDDLARKAGYALRRDLFGAVPAPRSQARYLRFLEPRSEVSVPAR
ncbi:hypothetical protein [uncultured Sphingomonas sp.]|uniref:hypothetical protein n=1 Tax=uncultured Sphingomonas sp. TaxID=158754 RepID=UPI0025F08E49|nr:hypothetical protein [uncultured Sphingomonas sp.]